MKNFIFISPNFPDSYWKFCDQLKKNGLRVLGIGDCPYDLLQPELRSSLHEYYRVDSLENYDEVFRAVAFFTFKYGKIDWLESNNEYWLQRDAHLRTEFNITSGFKDCDIKRVKLKSGMKEYYAKAGIPTARYYVVENCEDAIAFANRVGYPVVVKPDNGVGASGTRRLHNDDEVRQFVAAMDNSYIMEECIYGHVETYDAIIGAQGQPLFEAGNVTPLSLMDVVNNGDNSIYYIVKELNPKILDAGRRTVKAFDVRSRMIHLEYFVLERDMEGLGKVGDIVGLEVNMRPSGGYTPDMYNFARETDVYKIWADMIAFDCNTLPVDRPSHYCAFCGRRDGKDFIMNHEDILNRYGYCMMMWGRIPDALADCMSNQMYMANFDTLEEVQTYFSELLATRS